MRKKILFIVLLPVLQALQLTAFNQSVQAFEDPGGSLSKLDLLLGPPDFQRAFHSGDEFFVHRRNCEKWTGTCHDLTARYLVLRAFSDDAEVATYIADRTAPSRSEKIQRRQWNEISGNMARAIIRDIESYGAKVTVGEILKTEATIDVNGHPKPTVAFELRLSIENTMGPSTFQTLTLSPSFRGPGQVIRRRISDGTGGETTTELQRCRWEGAEYGPTDDGGITAAD